MSTSVLNPGLLINIAFLAPAKETNPRRQQPTGNKAAQADKGRLPNQKDGHSIGNGATNNSVGGGEKEKMNRADEQIDLGECSEFNEHTLKNLFADVEAEGMRRLAHERAAK